ncbi:MAG: Tol-Pal system beta propeller repeat protein TolB [Gammaproteobacteria bacterium]|nr:Tol-Pal system beta propeller repeat protein TolB [Gammaproteobacteria bacterium]
MKALDSKGGGQIGRVFYVAPAFFAFLFCVHLGCVQAEITIEITQGSDSAVPIAILPFGQEAPIAPFSSVIQQDLQRSGRFQAVQSHKFPEKAVRSSELTLSAWQNLGVESIVVGRIQPLSSSQYQVIFELVDVYKGQQKMLPSQNGTPDNPSLFIQNNSVLLAQEFIIHASESRKLAHQISDIIYERLTGERGIALTRIAYVSVVVESKQGSEYRLEVADLDGFNPRVIMRSKKPLMSPDWSKDGSKIAYVSFENGRSEIFIQNVSTGRREKIAPYMGLNTAPAWSPDGNKLALSLSKDGNSEIYVLHLETKRLERLTNDGAIDTEPAWAPDGKALIFTSDRGGEGKPQIYQFSFETRATKRLTFEGDYNARGRFTSDGRHIIMVNRQNGQFHIAVQEVETGTVFWLTDGVFDESPTVAPNGRLVLYATKEGGKGLLQAVSVDGRVRLRLPAREGEIREPAWSPFPIGLRGKGLSL